MKVSKQLKQKLSACHEITLDKSYYVDVQMKNTEKWYRARILDYKLSKGNHNTSQEIQNQISYIFQFFMLLQIMMPPNRKIKIPTLTTFIFRTQISEMMIGSFFLELEKRISKSKIVQWNKITPMYIPMITLILE